MTPVDQRRLYSKEAGTKGDCTQCCIASILDLAYEDVPDFIMEENFFRSRDAFLASKGLRMQDVAPWFLKPDRMYLACGTTVRTPLTGVHHMVIYQGDKLLFDPHPSKAGLVNVTEFYELVPIA